MTRHLTIVVVLVVVLVGSVAGLAGGSAQAAAWSCLTAPVACPPLGRLADLPERTDEDVWRMWHARVGSGMSVDASACTTPVGVQDIVFSKVKYPNIRKHFLEALRRGWPRTLVLNRPGAAKRRARLLDGVATKPGYDRDEYPPATARGKGRGLTRGADPRGWLANVELVPSHENRSHGASLGSKLRRFCNGTKFRYVFS